MKESWQIKVFVAMCMIPVTCEEALCEEALYEEALCEEALCEEALCEESLCHVMSKGGLHLLVHIYTHVCTYITLVSNHFRALSRRALS